MRGHLLAPWQLLGACSLFTGDFLSASAAAQVGGSKNAFPFAKAHNQNILFSPAFTPLPKLVVNIVGK